VSPAARGLWAGRTLALLGILLVALNLRTAVAALSPIVSEVGADIDLPVAVVGVLGMLPPVCFAVFGILTPAFTRRFGLESVLIVALVAILVGHLARGLAPDVVTLTAASALTFAGLGAGNVLLPPLVKKYFPDRIGLVTSVYVSILSVSTFLPPLLAVPVADAAGWRLSLGMWAFFALAALVPWIALIVRHRTAGGDDRPEEVETAILGRMWHSPIAWALTTIFAVSSLNAYAMFAWLPSILVDIADTSPGTSGVLLSLYAAMGLPSGILIPWLAARMRRVGILVYAGAAFFTVGYLGLLLAPTTATWLWVAMAGLGPLLFPLSLVLINLRTRTHTASVALSGFVQGVGYTIGAFGPLLVGLVHEWTGGWSAPIILLGVASLASIFAGAVVARPHMLEDEHRHR
jgi:CP family cyanate transporter-like MFS transporter